MCGTSDSHLNEMKPSNDRFHLLILSARSMLLPPWEEDDAISSDARAALAPRPRVVARAPAAGEGEREVARERQGDRVEELLEDRERY